MSYRSALFTPATRPERFAHAAEVGADLLIIDLEDAVAPADKATARAHAVAALASPMPGIRRVIRINALGTRIGLDDLTALLATSVAPELILLPKTESPVHLELLDRLLCEVGAATGLIALLESARGIQAANEIVHAPRLAAVMVGAADLAADLGCDLGAPNLIAARAVVIAAANPHGVVAIDSPWFDIADKAGLLEDTTRARAMGFIGKAAIHPSQIATINDIFTPGPDEVAHARAVLATNIAGVGVVDGQMVDEAVARKARRVLASAGLAN